MDTWIIFDNFGEKPKIVACGKSGVPEVLDVELFDRIRRQAGIL